MNPATNRTKPVMPDFHDKPAPNALIRVNPLTVWIPAFAGMTTLGQFVAEVTKGGHGRDVGAV